MMHHRTVYATTILGTITLLKALCLPVAGQAPTKSEPLAQVDGELITAAEVDKALGASLAKLEEQIYSLKRQKIEALISERLMAREAARRTISVQALLDAEVTAKIGPVTEQEIETVYQANKARVPGQEATVREQVRAYLHTQKLASQRETFVQSLRSQAKAVVYLKPPPVFRAEVAVEGSPSRGSLMAPVTVAEFSDFHCHFCKQVQPTLAQLLSRYGEKVKLVYRNFPIDSLHPVARKAAEAAQCANDQGKFWPFHDKLFANGPDASPEKLKSFAGELGLDVSAFEHCFSTRKYQTRVQKDVEDGARIGISGTPAFFINGRMLSGAQPLENFVRVIDEELAQMP